MNQDYLVYANFAYNLQDAHEELTKILELIKPNSEFDEEYFEVKMAHLYWHLNNAWNTRNISGEQLESADGKQMNLWGEFPKDLKPL